MRYDVEHQRNIAFDLIRLKNNGISIADYFQQGETVIIYGMGFLGMELYGALKGRVKFVCFMDRAHDMEFYDGIPIFAMENPSLGTRMKGYSEVKVIVTVTQARKQIIEEINNRFPNAVPLTLYSVTASLKLEKSSLLNKKQPLALNIAKKIIRNQDAGIDRIVVLGTSYTELLSFLVLPDCRKTLYITDRFFPKIVIEKMTECGIPCLSEMEAGEFYDLTYLIAEYAAKRKIPVYGHDHLFLSRAFLENPIILIEDGVGNYNIKNAMIYKNILDSGDIYRAFGADSLVKKIFLTGLGTVPEELSNKVEYFDPAEQWQKKSSGEKQLISQIFAFPYKELLELTACGKTTLFLTEPYAHRSGLETLTVDKMVEMYREILSDYNMDEIIIKPHPSDHTDYETLMPGYSVVSGHFPIQMIPWTGIPVKKVILMQSSTCRHCFSHGYETDVRKDLLNL